MFKTFKSFKPPDDFGVVFERLERFEPLEPPIWGCSWNRRNRLWVVV